MRIVCLVSLAFVLAASACGDDEPSSQAEDCLVVGDEDDDGHADCDDSDCDALPACQIGCGDGVVQGSEACDGTNLNGQTCLTIAGGFDGGTLACSACMFDTSACTSPASCGDGEVEGSEACDGANLNGQTCLTVAGGFDGGTLACSACMFDTSGCTSPAVCGDGEVEGGEACDGANLNGQTCLTVVGGFDGGTLACSACRFDTSACTVTVSCGDGVAEGGEACDDGNTASADGCSATCEVEPFEIEPNDDGTPDPGAQTSDGNDIDATAVANADANGAFDVVDGDVTIRAALAPAGDEDLFAITNSGVDRYRVRLDTWNLAPGFGLGAPCSFSIDPLIRVIDADLDQLDINDDRSPFDLCAGLELFLAPGQTVYVHVIVLGDSFAIPSYALTVDAAPLICGDGEGAPGEQCDDGNTVAGDGCDAACVIEGALAETEPNDDLAAAAASPLEVTGDAVVTGALTPGDVDLHRIVVTASGVVRIEGARQLRPWQCRSDFGFLELRLLGANGVELAVSDEAPYCGALTVHLEPGTYYLEIDAGFFTFPIPFYLLDVHFDADAGAETETAGTTGSNETIATAEVNLIGGGGMWSFGDHVIATDVDFYAVTVPASHGLRAEIIEGDFASETCVADATGLDSRLTLFDANGIQLVNDDDGGRGWCSMIDGTNREMFDPDAVNTSAVAQTFYLMVRQSIGPIGNGGEFVYRLAVSTRPVSP